MKSHRYKGKMRIIIELIGAVLLVLGLAIAVLQLSLLIVISSYIILYATI